MPCSGTRLRHADDSGFGNFTRQFALSPNPALIAAA
jgi:hypothetical protein